MLHLELAVPTDWRRIDQVRGAVSQSVSAVLGDRDTKDALAMVSAELLENAFKYGKPGQREVSITVHLDHDQLMVSVTNAIEEDSPHPRLLVERLAWVRTFQSPLAAYEAALRRTLGGQPDQSGLGLARISYEGGFALDCDTSTAGQVTVRAACPITRFAPA